MYSQVVFFMHPEATKDKPLIDFVAEAENIIHKYVQSKGISDYSPPTILPAFDERIKAYRPKRRFSFDFPVYVLMGLACAAIAAIFAFGLLS